MLDVTTLRLCQAPWEDLFLVAWLLKPRAYSAFTTARSLCFLGTRSSFPCHLRKSWLLCLQAWREALGPSSLPVPLLAWYSIRQACPSHPGGRDWSSVWTVHLAGEPAEVQQSLLG